VSRPAVVRVLVVLVGLQALGLLGAAVYLGVETAVASPDDRTRAVVAGVLAFAAAAGMAVATRGLWQGRRWARAPVLVANVLVLPVALDLVRSGRGPAAVALGLWALAVLGLLFAPAVSDWLED
jgi:hypothetical protein